MAIPIIKDWRSFFIDENEGLGSSYERVVLNKLLSRICKEYEIKEVLEAPLFGFTGISGINSMELAREGKEITLVDNNSERLVMIEKVWESCRLHFELRHSPDFNSLPFEDKSFDMSWNFSALWFVSDLQLFLSELDRVTRKVILITVPNRTGLGFILQRLTGNRKYKELVNPTWLRYSRFSKIMDTLGWELKDEGLIDSPPWPDIGMKKEILARKLGLSFLLDRDPEDQQGHSIMDYYRGRDETFPERMMKYYGFEKRLPKILKQFWAHHHYYLYVKKGLSS